ncbi:MAG: hydroxymyristoyl-ACP dehydratase [Casimicrobium sp.]|jgi:3-hydroxyacyl-[acyl-carrier-protein] dehydratase
MTRIVFDFCVSSSHPSLPGHFPGHPVVPGVVLLDCVMSHLYRVTDQRITQLQQVKFASPVRPDESIHVQCELFAARLSFHATTIRGGETITVITGKFSFPGAERLPQ